LSNSDPQTYRTSHSLSLSSFRPQQANKHRQMSAAAETAAAEGQVSFEQMQSMRKDQIREKGSEYKHHYGAAILSCDRRRRRRRSVSQLILLTKVEKHLFDSRFRRRRRWQRRKSIWPFGRTVLGLASIRHFTALYPRIPKARFTDVAATNQEAEC
jgi:hypothetical protein